jgi:hypothetical protein
MVVGTANPNAAASPRRENAPRREISCSLMLETSKKSPLQQPSRAPENERPLNNKAAFARANRQDSLITVGLLRGIYCVKNVCFRGNSRY